jgi:hypothetical protein
MSLIAEPGCPRCGGVVPLVRLWSWRSVRGFGLRPNTGVVCPTCGALLAVVHVYAVVIGFISLLVIAALYTLAIVLLGEAVHHKLSNGERLVVQALLVSSFVAWVYRVVPRFCRLRAASEEEKLYLWFAESDGDTRDF